VRVSLHTLQLGDERLRIGPWRGESTTAYVVPLPEAGPLTSAGVRRCLEQLRASGFRAALTAALAPPDQSPFADAGFVVHERLHLLARDLEDLPAAAGQMRRSWRRDRAQVLEVDAAAFPPFWRLDGAALDDAVAATPSARFRVTVDHSGDPALTGYAITGRAGPRGYLQRLAVRPAAEGRGIGTALVVDGLQWLKRRGADQVLVNTQVGNERAVRLYEHLGFRHRPDGLAVLRVELTDG
jgi:ribosomal protein S18 acetylase RimI-like enzyme